MSTECSASTGAPPRVASSERASTLLLVDGAVLVLGVDVLLVGRREFPDAPVVSGEPPVLLVLLAVRALACLTFNVPFQRVA